MLEVNKIQTLKAATPASRFSSLFQGATFPVVAGPCSFEGIEQSIRIGEQVRALGARALRGGIFKMRTSRHAFQGLGIERSLFIKDTKAQTNLPLISEITDPRQIESLGELIDVFQVGARNMYNYELLKELSLQEKPVMLKRAFSATVREWLGAAEYIKGGPEQVILCERGIRTFETTTRNTLDLNSVAYIKQHTPYKIFVDPSHGTGVRELVRPMSCAAMAAGADGLIIEVHDRPLEALSDGDQAITMEIFRDLMEDLRKMAPIFGKKI